jgi:hypothetical protein
MDSIIIIIIIIIVQLQVIQAGTNIFLTSPKRPHGFWSPLSLSNHWVPEALSLEVKRPDQEADHLLLSGTEYVNI